MQGQPNWSGGREPLWAGPSPQQRPIGWVWVWVSPAWVWAVRPAGPPRPLVYVHQRAGGWTMLSVPWSLLGPTEPGGSGGSSPAFAASGVTRADAPWRRACLSSGAGSRGAACVGSGLRPGKQVGCRGWAVLILPIRLGSGVRAWPAPRSAQGANRAPPPSALGPAPCSSVSRALFSPSLTPALTQASQRPSDC